MGGGGGGFGGVGGGLAHALSPSVVRLVRVGLCREDFVQVDQGGTPITYACDSLASCFFFTINGARVCVCGGGGGLVGTSGHPPDSDSSPPSSSPCPWP
jgi:hypothetical protein